MSDYVSGSNGSVVNVEVMTLLDAIRYRFALFDAGVSVVCASVPMR